MISKMILPLLSVMLSVACVLTGCQSPKASPLPGSSAAQATLNNCHCLLHQPPKLCGFRVFERRLIEGQPISPDHLDEVAQFRMAAGLHQE